MLADSQSKKSEESDGGCDNSFKQRMLCVCLLWQFDRLLRRQTSKQTHPRQTIDDDADCEHRASSHITLATTIDYTTTCLFPLLSSNQFSLVITPLLTTTSF
jgi:hypothetical protein